MKFCDAARGLFLGATTFYPALARLLVARRAASMRSPASPCMTPGRAPGFWCRDLKLDNTLLDGSSPPNIKICDFGFAKTWETSSNMFTHIGWVGLSAQRSPSEATTTVGRLDRLGGRPCTRCRERAAGAAPQHPRL
jgi:hypothetical protein